jgi:glutamate decarboxylase
VQSINASGHKYGLVYPGVGWVVWRDESALPGDLVFRVDYLGGDMATFALNFSRPAAQVVAQYYTFVRLGFQGYRKVLQECRETAVWLAGRIGQMGPFELVSAGTGVPAFAFGLRAEAPYSVFDVSEFLRGRGWIVPAYAMPPALDGTKVLRVVVRNGFSRDLATLFVADLGHVVDRLAGGRGSANDESRTGFHH